MIPPTPYALARRRNARRLGLIAGAVTIALLVACCAVSLTYGPYATDHDIPNPYWGTFNGSYNYTPEQGPPSPVLMDIRPETVIARFLDDYIRLAGTYPCIHEIDRFTTEEDPVFEGLPCTVIRPVKEYYISKVTVPFHGLFGHAEADVYLTITYSDGRTKDERFALGAYEYDPYGLVAHIHMNCWQFIESLLLYNRLVSEVPKGVRYTDKATGALLCQT